MTPELAGFAARNVPRYTSYPTAPHFTAGIGAADYADWLAALPEEATLSLYFHIPFCLELCLYCGCNTKAVRQQEPIDRYTQTLLAEIDIVSALTGRRKVTHLHWGGGTPSMLGDAGFRRLMDRLHRVFDLGTLREHAIELDPRRVTSSFARTLADDGVDRASLGVQDFSSQVQQAIGRIQPFDVVARTASLLREAGIDRLNIDLMYGLPEQRQSDVVRSADLASSLDPARLALFGYAHVPWLKKHQRLIDESRLPDTQARLAQARVAAATLADLGYRPIGFDHFADPRDELAIAAQEGRLRRNFQGYTVDNADALIGFGASAISRTPQGFAQNAPDVARHARAIESGRLPIVKGIALAAEDRLRWAIIERLLCDFAVDLDDLVDGLSGAAGRFSGEIAALAPFARAGLVQIDGNRIAIPEQGRNFARLIASTFDAYLPANKARHSVAV